MNPKKNPLERRRRPVRHPGHVVRVLGGDKQTRRNKQSTLIGYMKGPRL